jgi:hypothetical protein
MLAVALAEQSPVLAESVGARGGGCCFALALRSVLCREGEHCNMFSAKKHCLAPPLALFFAK